MSNGKRSFVAALLGLCLLTPACLRMDRFLFAPWIVDEYLRPGDIDSIAWHVRFVIPDTLYEEVELASSGDNAIYGFLVRPDSSSSRDDITILYNHGNSHCINRYWGRVELLWEMGYRVFIYDYQGYGKSDGSPSGDACFADGRAALEYLLDCPEVDPERIVYYGWSMGTFITTYLAADSVTPLGLVLESPPASASALVREGTVFDVPGSMITEFDFDNVRRIAHVGVPVLLMHGEDDDYLPPSRHALPLVQEAQGHTPMNVVLVPGAGHEDVPHVLGDEYSRLVTDYIHRRAMEHED